MARVVRTLYANSTLNFGPTANAACARRCSVTDVLFPEKRWSMQLRMWLSPAFRNYLIFLHGRISQRSMLKSRSDTL